MKGAWRLGAAWLLSSGLIVLPSQQCHHDEEVMYHTSSFSFLASSYATPQMSAAAAAAAACPRIKCRNALGGTASGAQRGHIPSKVQL